MSDSEIRDAIRSGEFEKAARLAMRVAAGATSEPTTREAWLERMTEALRPMFVEAGRPLPAKVRVSVGFPSKGGTRARMRVIGQCWSGSCTNDGAPHVFVSPVIEGEQAAEVLVHELAHAAAGIECGHKGRFAQLARLLGLVGKLTATTAGPELKTKLATIAKGIGGYPHAPLRAEEVAKQKKDGVRQIKGTCECGRIMRASRTVWEQGPVLCGLCSSQFVAEIPEGEDEPEAGETREAAGIATGH